MSEEDLDKHFTDDEVADRLIELSSIENYDLVLEPSAGGGSISSKIPIGQILAFDIDPILPYIKKQDYTQYTHPETDDEILVIGNPPFGYRAQLAVEFFNKSAEFAKTISFILPRSFRKAYVVDQLNPYFHLVHDENVDVGSFSTDTKVRCCIQIWDRRGYLRRKQAYNGTTSDFTVQSQGKDFDPLKCDIAIRRTGYGDTVGQLVPVQEATPITQFIFLNVAHEGIIENLKNISSDLYKYSYNATAISPTFTIKELIYVYNQKYGDKGLSHLLE
jgi:hypothetical protein